jgi:catechol 2,3-dioxygenase-like lactoylglutathione lyase family enzyme
LRDIPDLGNSDCPSPHLPKEGKDGAGRETAIFLCAPAAPARRPPAGYTTAMITTPAIRGIVETCINVSDMTRARRFYESLFGFEAMVQDERFCAYRVGSDVLLLFTEGSSSNPIAVSGGIIPPHATVGAGHFAFAVSRDELETWRVLLQERGIGIESEVQWERGGSSIYFRDPDGNLVELVSPGTWLNY